MPWGWHQILARAPTKVAQYPAPAEFEGESPSSNAALYASGPWMFPRHVRLSALIDQSVRGGLLPGGIPEDVILTDDWQRHGAIRPEWIQRRRNESARYARARYVRLVYLRFVHTPGRTLIASLRLGVSGCRHDEEEPYAGRLAAWMGQESWASGEPAVFQGALLLDVQLVAEFRFARKRGNTAYWDKICLERRARSRLGYLIPYPHMEVDAIKRHYRERCYVALPIPQWNLVEICEGFVAELPPFLTYLSSELLEKPSSPLWKVVYTEFVAMTAVHWPWDVYDTCRMWYLTPTVVTLMRRLDLWRPLGGDHNHAEFRSLLDLYAEADWNDPEQTPLVNSKRNSSAPNFSPGRRHPTCGD